MDPFSVSPDYFCREGKDTTEVMIREDLFLPEEAVMKSLFSGFIFILECLKRTKSYLAKKSAMCSQIFGVISNAAETSLIEWALSSKARNSSISSILCVNVIHRRKSHRNHNKIYTNTVGYLRILSQTSFEHLRSILRPQKS